MTDLTLGQRIAEERKKLGLSQEALGEKMGVSRQAISKWEADAAVPEIDKLIVLSKLFDTSVGWLLGVEEAPAEKQADTLSEAQLQMVEGIVKQYQPKLPSQKLRLAQCAVLAVLILVLGLVYLREQNMHNRLAASEAAVDSLNFTLSSAIAELESHIASQTIVQAQTPAPTLLADYRLEIASIASGDRPHAEICFSGVPATWQKGDSAVLSFWRAGEGTVQLNCTWDGTFLTTVPCMLEVVDGYEICFVLRHGDGTQEQQVLSDYVVQNLKTSLSITASVIPGKWNWVDNTISLRNYEFQVTMPQNGKFYGSLQWKSVDVILTYADGEEIGRYNLLSPDTEEDADVLASTNIAMYHPEVNFVGLELKPNAGVLLWLYAETNNGMTCMQPIDGWSTNAEGRPLHTTAQ